MITFALICWIRWIRWINACHLISLEHFHEFEDSSKTVDAADWQLTASQASYRRLFIPRLQPDKVSHPLLSINQSLSVG